MGSLFRYSAITAKLSSMRSRFLTDENFKELASKKSVPAAVEYLKGFPSYTCIFQDVGEADLHRSRIEELLSLSLYDDYSKLYRFADRKQRKFLDLYFMHFEIDVLKKCLRNSLSNRRSDLNLSDFENFFRKHSRFDFLRLSESTSLPEFLENLSGTFFHEPLKALYEQGVTSLFEYETALDTLYFKRLWKELNRKIGKAEKEAVLSSIGEKIDLLNLEWLARAKQRYHLSKEAVTGCLIPVCYRLTKKQLSGLCASEDPEEFKRLLAATRYGSRLSGKAAPSLRSLLNAVYRNSERKDPYSAAALNSYFYFKEEEIHKLITAIEGIRYSLDGNEILSCLA